MSEREFEKDLSLTVVSAEVEETYKELGEALDNIERVEPIDERIKTLNMVLEELEALKENMITKGLL